MGIKKAFTLALAAAATACGTESPSGEPLRSDNSGRWLLRGSVLSASCLDYVSGFPFASQAVQVSSDASTLAIGSPELGERVYAGQSGAFARNDAVSKDGCNLSSETSWTFHSVVETRLSATYTLTVSGSGDCPAELLRSCTTTFGVSGVRQ
jgi:hypothetical protein